MRKHIIPDIGIGMMVKERQMTQKSYFERRALNQELPTSVCEEPVRVRNA